MTSGLAESAHGAAEICSLDLSSNLGIVIHTTKTNIELTNEAIIAGYPNYGIKCGQAPDELNCLALPAKLQLGSCARCEHQTKTSLVRHKPSSSSTCIFTLPAAMLTNDGEGSNEGYCNSNWDLQNVILQSTHGKLLAERCLLSETSSALNKYGAERMSDRPTDFIRNVIISVYSYS